MPIFHVIGADAAVFGILLGCDMGGYQLAMSLAENRQIALMMGLSTAAQLVEMDEEGVDHHRAVDDSMLSLSCLRKIYQKERLRRCV